MSSYVGSSNDGHDDPHKGYAAYDFESIMHYPAADRFDTVPSEAESLTGQRHRLSEFDIAQIIDVYQCRELGSQTLTTTAQATTTTVAPALGTCNCTATFSGLQDICSAAGRSNNQHICEQSHET